MPIIITKRFFIPPVEAFELVAKESFGAELDEVRLWDFESDQHRITVGNLRAALESGHVDAFWECRGQKGRLEPHVVNHDLFAIDLLRNSIHLPDFGGEIVQCTINLDDLVDFVRSHGRTDKKFSVRDETQCERWLEDLFSQSSDLPSKNQLLLDAQRKFNGLSKAAFTRARKRAIKSSGRTDLQKAGRRPAKTEI